LPADTPELYEAPETELPVLNEFPEREPALVKEVLFEIDELFAKEVPFPAEIPEL